MTHSSTLCTLFYLRAQQVQRFVHYWAALQSCASHGGADRDSKTDLS